ncbi:hypothetical protein DERF_001680 [Dermatophagoides farinae]|uniref:Uncharacterized protein n=1 Tax=Dermatophagoides farinae TaxID=6954 RepID=A0A922IFD6_DERFA|nr:hypothetical protein DERF_001680 [Dermatophagoides farinae]
MKPIKIFCKRFNSSFVTSNGMIFAIVDADVDDDCTVLPPPPPPTIIRATNFGCAFTIYYEIVEISFLSDHHHHNQHHHIIPKRRLCICCCNCKTSLLTIGVCTVVLVTATDEPSGPYVAVVFDNND